MPVPSMSTRLLLAPLAFIFFFSFKAESMSSSTARAMFFAFAAVMGYLGVQLPASFNGFGRMLIDGLVNGITSRLAAVKATIMNVANAAKGWFKSALGIKSPSRVFREFGGFMTQGLAIGIDRGADDAVSRVRRLAGRMASAGLAIAAPTVSLQQASAAVLARTGPVPRLAAVGDSGMSPTTAAPAAGVVNKHYYNETIQIILPEGAGADARSFARRVMAAIEDERRSRAARSYADD